MASLRLVALNFLAVAPLVLAASAVTFCALVPATAVLLAALAILAVPVLLLCYLSTICAQLLYAERILWGPLVASDIAYALACFLWDLVASRVLVHHGVFWAKWALRDRAKLDWRVLRGIRYGACEGAVLDVYRPPLHARTRRRSIHVPGGTLRSNPPPEALKTPVLIFVYGSGWNSGSKSIYTPLGWLLSRLGFTVVIPSYRSFPDGKISDMVADLEDCLIWTHANISAYGGDPTNLVLIGHSAGAHLAALAALSPALHGAYLDVLAASGRATAAQLADASLFLGLRKPAAPSVPSLRTCVLIAGVYDLPQHYAFETARGVERLSGLHRAAGSTYGGMLVNSPTALLAGLLQTLRNGSGVPEPGGKYKLAARLPQRILLVHGSKDAVVPSSQSKTFYHALRAAMPNCELLLCDSSNHTTIITDLMHESALCGEIVKFIDGNIKKVEEEQEVSISKQATGSSSSSITAIY